LAADIKDPSRAADLGCIVNRDHIAAQILLRSWPFPRGAGRLLDKFFSRTEFPEETSTVRTTDGFLMNVPPNDLIGRHIYLTGEFDRSMVEVLCNFAVPGDTLLDVGANIGYVSACFLKNIEQSTVVAVEPTPATVELLKKNLAQFGPRQSIFPFALSDRDGEAHFRIDKANKGASRIVENETEDSIRVPLRSAATVFEDPKLAKVDLVKIDVENHEEPILSACKAALARLNPRAILFEHTGVQCAPGNSIAKLFDEIGYDIVGIRKRLTRLELDPIRSEADRTYNDFLAISRTRAIPYSAKLAYGL
jgi:FkbM family methyltransferase